MPQPVPPLLSWPDAGALLMGAGRLVLAGALGALLGLQREKVNSAAGLRTHILVGLGSALFVVASVQAGDSSDAISRVIQGVIAGIGFLGAGTILKATDRLEIQGLTTAASIWVTAAVGVAAGLGHVWLPTFAAVLGWSVLGPLARLEKGRRSPPPGD